jgi:hypothetical protein
MDPAKRRASWLRYYYKNADEINYRRSIRRRRARIEFKRDVLIPMAEAELAVLMRVARP